jgi:hypothetical protein
MIKKVSFLFLIVFNILVIVYLLSPVPNLPDLENSVKSDLPGDTVQITNVSGYFTNLSRQEVINFYKNKYQGLFRISLNHPPEKAKEIILDTIPSYYLEELVLPFKESLYINGFEWEKDVFTKPEKRIKNRIYYQDQEYSSKITIRRFPVPIFDRLFTFFITETGIIFAFFVYKKLLKRNV